jgi:hypothetical protein
MNTLFDNAYKLASTFFLSSCHDDWSGSRIRNAVLADIDGDDKRVISDQQELVIWDPIERYLDVSCSPMSDVFQELDDLIEGLAHAFVDFAKENHAAPIRRVVIEHKVKQIGKSANKFPARIIPAEAFGGDFDKYEGLTLRHEEGKRDGVWVSYSQTYLYTKKSDEQLLREFN